MLKQYAMNVDTFDFNMQMYVCVLASCYDACLFYDTTIAIIGSEKGGAIELQPHGVLHRIL